LLAREVLYETLVRSSPRTLCIGDPTMRTTSLSLRLLVLFGFSVGAVGCGEIQVPLIFALEEGSAIIIAVPGFGPGGSELVLGTTNLEGGIDTTITADLHAPSIFRDHIPITGVMDISDLLFGGSEFDILGNPTGTICTVPNPNGSLSGEALVYAFDDQGKRLPGAVDIDVDMDLDTAIKITDPVLGGAIPDGFPFTIVVSDSTGLAVSELIALVRGNADGVLSITQPLDESFVAEVLPGLFLPLHITGQLNFTTANAFPTGMLIDECIAFLEQ